jgi:hypothetical protein
MQQSLRFGRSGGRNRTRHARMVEKAECAIVRNKTKGCRCTTQCESELNYLFSIEPEHKPILDRRVRIRYFTFFEQLTGYLAFSIWRLSMKLGNLSSTLFLLSLFCLLLSNDALAGSVDYSKMELVATPTDGGIREDVPDKLRGKYERWKSELLSTEIGRRQWEAYANSKQFVLVIKVVTSRGKGAGTDKFQWNGEGRLVGATITLGAELDNGYPNAIYYPVLNSLSGERPAYQISGNLLAATKMAHEIGHVIQTAQTDMNRLQTQYKLIPLYGSIFLSNGRNIRDERLVALVGKIGGTPIEIWESHEYLSEVNAMRFLEEKIKDEDFYCYVFSRIKDNVETYAGSYSKWFDPGAARCSRSAPKK